jgi:RNase H-fold protein (predicted Holliday junction resolvase)
MSYLALDYGSSHIGVAISNGILAEPLTTVPTKIALSSIKEIIKKYKIEGLIIGDTDPEFLIRLKLMNIPIYIVDETLSSFDARQSLLHTSQKRRKQKEHSAAAAIILQSWLDSKPTNR